MGKRICPFDDDDHIQKQQVIDNNVNTTRKIKSSVSEKTLQLLYKGARLQNEPQPNYINDSCISCSNSSSVKCWYCLKDICQNCSMQCDKCNEMFCGSCAFQVYDAGQNSLCYSCF
ncbi:unnamed protein product [Brassicogethes aeneus]|uniref:Apoptosis regulatory protein Siva n=1 Tax=Brassicogethes aeneus TaxID=1431903 RepID=A0A9P0BF97_BRAAE|nr:unnamed protein product [Brassicogethes aeneus]